MGAPIGRFASPPTGSAATCRSARSHRTRPSGSCATSSPMWNGHLAGSRPGGAAAGGRAGADVPRVRRTVVGRARTGVAGENRRSTIRWRLERHLLPHFADHRLTAITVAEVDRYKPRSSARELSRRFDQQDAHHALRHPGMAEERDLIPRNPARGKRRRVKSRKVRRLPWIRPTRSPRCSTRPANSTPKRDGPRGTPSRACSALALLATYMFAGLRTAEALTSGGRTFTSPLGRLQDRKVQNGSGQAGRASWLPVLRDESRP